MSDRGEQALIVAGLLALLAALICIPEWDEAWAQYKRAITQDWRSR